MKITKLKQIIKRKKIKLQDLASDLKISIEELNSKLNGEKPFLIIEVAYLKKRLNLSNEKMGEVFFTKAYREFKERKLNERFINSKGVEERI